MKTKDVNSGECPDNAVCSVSWSCLLHMNNTAGDSPVPNHKEICGTFWFGAEEDLNIYSTLDPALALITITLWQLFLLLLPSLYIYILFIILSAIFLIMLLIQLAVLWFCYSWSLFYFVFLCNLLCFLQICFLSLHILSLAMIIKHLSHTPVDFSVLFK